MSLPLGVVCVRCERVFGSILTPPVDQIPRDLKFICGTCIGGAASELGLKLDTDESWQKLRDGVLKR